MFLRVLSGLGFEKKPLFPSILTLIVKPKTRIAIGIMIEKIVIATNLANHSGLKMIKATKGNAKEHRMIFFHFGLIFFTC